MGSANSRIEEDKVLQLCRERKKFVRQALDGRCSLAAAHVSYVQSLRNTATALRRFVEPPEAPLESSLYTSTTATPEPLALTHSSPSPPTANHMKFTGFSSTKVEEKPPPVITATVTPPSTETSAPWDFFGLFHPIDHQFSTQHTVDDIRRLREEEGIPELEDEQDKHSFSATEEHLEDSEDEFDQEDPPADTLVRSFQNLNRQPAHNSSPTVPSAETQLFNGEKSNSPDMSPLTTPADTPLKHHPLPPKDFFSSIKDIESLFIKASQAGTQVPRMLEANKLHFRPIAPPNQHGSMVSTFFKACFSCGEDPTQVQEEPAQNDVKYLTWHRTTSSRSSSSRNPLGLNAKDDAEDFTGNLFENFCMNSGSHVSTLDRLYAWERKLYDEVKASEMVRKEYDSKLTILRQLESKGEHSHKIDKTRAVVKDLHSRIRVAIHRIDSISKKIEELRDKELQPQLEELIDGLSRMWEVMFECHKRQFQIITIAYNHRSAKISIQSESHREIGIHLEYELHSLSSCFSKWIGAQVSYLRAINDWLFKCVFLPQKPTKKKRRSGPSPSLTLRRSGPPIYVTCGLWLEKLEALPAKEVVEAIKGLAAETSHLLPRQEKNQGKSVNVASWKTENGGDLGINLLRDEEASDDGLERFRSSLERFIGQLNKFSEGCVTMFVELQKAIRDAKNPQPQAPPLQPQG
ncbi:protein ALTERED PHOSPHATE STARVATION RESPONSE 1 [Mercurialis annua]|uniref:protein ALTERED PHOSPHATE STARVATION RESPONSE 1 n=1 Tax=Mercurialis annua TaxID=3986 RepID=UPI00215E2EA7|nr:protein ALTERED PHOSPHATE STARVATION RESPONSE 1 [Mercurialis annua]